MKLNRLFILIAGVLFFSTCLQVNAAFQPTDIVGCRLWLDANDPTNGGEIVPEGPLSTWVDKSPRANDAVQSDTTKQPSYTLHILNGKPGIVFDGEDDNFELNSRDTNIRTVFWVLRETDNQELHFFLGDSTNADFYRGTNGNLWDPDNTNPGILNGQTYLDKNEIDGTTTKLPLESFHQIAMKTNGTALSFDNISMDRLGVEAGKNWKGEILEIIAYDTVLNDNLIDNVNNYLHTKWFNNPPYGCPDSFELGMNSTLTVSTPGLLLNDGDYEHSPISALISETTSHGDLKLHNDGSFSYEPNPNWVGHDSFTYHVNDGNLDSADITVDLTIIPPDANIYAKVFGIHGIYIPSKSEPNPEAGTDFGLVGKYKTNFFRIYNSGLTPIDDISIDFSNSNSIFSASAISSLPLAPGDSLNFSITAENPPIGAEKGTAVITIDEKKYYLELTIEGNPVAPPKVKVSYSGTVISNAAPPSTSNGTDFGTVNTGYSTTNTFTITNNGEEDLIIDGSPIFSITGPSEEYFHIIKHGKTILHSGESSDFELSFRSETPSATSSAKVTFATNDPDNPYFTLIVTGKTQLSLNGNHIPIAETDKYAVKENNKLEVEAINGVLKNDTDQDPNTDLIARVVEPPKYGSLIFDSDGSFTYTPSENFYGYDTFTYKCADNYTFSKTTIVKIKVNTAPIALNDEYILIKEFAPLSIAPPGIQINDYDPDNSIVYSFLETGTSNGTTTLAWNGSFTYDPNSNFEGLDSFYYVNSDSLMLLQGTQSSQRTEVNINVIDTKNPPISYKDAYTMAINTTLNVPPNGVLNNDIDVDGNTLYAELISDVSQGSLTLNQDGSFEYVPAPGYTGDDEFTYRANDGVFYGNITTVHLTINDGTVNTPPIALDDSYEIMQDHTLNIPIPGVLDNDIDPDGDAITAVFGNAPSNGNVTLNTDGSFVYTPNPGYSGLDHFTYVANDGTDDSNVAIVNINVTENKKPVANDDTYSLSQNDVLSIPAPGIMNNDNDPESDPLTASLKTDVQHGSLTLNADGSFSYDPENTFTGSDSFEYTINDGYHDSEVAKVTLNVTTTGTNNPPVAINDSYETAKGVSLSVTSSNGVISNDYDVDQDSLTVSLLNPPSHGNLTLNPNGSFDYDPIHSFVGEDHFEYTLSDGIDIDTATVVIDVKIPTYSISGTITGDEPSGITIEVDSSHSAVSDASGNYSITGLTNGIYTVTPSLGGYTFTPENQSVTINDADETGIDFSSKTLHALIVNNGTGSGNYTEGTTVDISADIPAGQVFDKWTGDTTNIADVNAGVTTITMPDSDVSITATFKAPPPNTYSISGTVSGDIQAGVTVEADATHSAITDASGNYTVDGLVDGTYTVTPSLTGYSFTPPTANTTIAGANVTGVDFTSATAPITYTLTVEHGTGSGSFSEGDDVDISADIPAGQVFDKWTGDTAHIADVNDPTTTVTMPAADITVTATFKATPPNTYSISGTVSGDVQAGVTVEADATHSAITDASGNYTIDGLVDGTYTITPSLTGYTFTPASRDITVNGANENGVDFTSATGTSSYTLTVEHGTGSGSFNEGDAVSISADVPAGQVFDKWTGDTANIADVNDPTTTVTMPAADITVTATFKATPPNTYSISGTVSGDIQAGVTVEADATHSAITDASGNYTIDGLVDGTYTITPSLTGYTFTPASRDITVNGANENGVDFTSASIVSTYTLTVEHGTGSGSFSEGDAVNISADVPAGQVFDAWTGDITHIADVNDPTTTVTMPAADITVTATFKATPPNTYSISGTVSGDVQAGVTVEADAAHSAITDASGNYTIGGLVDGTYTVTPSLTGYTFTPASRDITVNGANENGVDFTSATIVSTYTLTVEHGTGSGSFSEGDAVNISADVPAGQIFDAWTGDTANIADVNDPTTTVIMPAADITVTATFKATPPNTYSISGTVSGDIQAGVTVEADDGHSAITDASGNYTIGGLINDTYTVTPSITGYTFNPQSRNITINGANENGVDFSAAEANTPPVAVDDDYSTSIGQLLTVNAPGILENDTDIDNTPDELSVILEDDVAHGTLNLNADGSFTYTPIAGFSGNDNFTYRANDGENNSNIATVTISVNIQKVTLGSKVSITPNDVTGLPGISFAKTPKIYGTVHSGSKDKKVSLKKDKSSTETLAIGTWSKKVPIYDKKAVKSGYNAYIVAGLQIPQTVQLMVAGKTDSDKFKDLPAIQVQLTPPEIESVSHTGTNILISGNYFGTKAPKVSLEPVAGGKVVKLKVDKKAFQSGTIGTPGRISASYKEGKIEPGAYYLVINNKIGIGVMYRADGTPYLPTISITH